MKHTDVLIVGGGHGGAAAAQALRKQGFQGSVLLVGKEAVLPYERPPLSKDYLARKKTFERLLIRPREFWADRKIEMTLGQEVVALDPAAKQVALSSGDRIGYRHLIWAAGGEARRLSCDGAHLAGVHTVRSQLDVDRLMTEIDQGATGAVIIGGGYIGLEAAAALRKLGLQVVLLEMENRVLSRVAGEDLSRFYEKEHRDQGVDLRLGVKVDCLEGEGGWLRGVKLADGSLIPADVAIVGIGIVPSVGPLIAAGASGTNGVDVDEYCRTRLEDVYAIGDCATHRNAFADGAALRLESVQNANDMAEVAARAICAEKEPYRAVPWFWSNQYDLNLQTVGLSIGHDRAVLRGSPADRKFSVIYLRDGRIIALDCVNKVADFVQGKKIVQASARIDPLLLQDASVPLNAMEWSD